MLAEKTDPILRKIKPNQEGISVIVNTPLYSKFTKNMTMDSQNAQTASKYKIIVTALDKFQIKQRMSIE